MTVSISNRDRARKRARDWYHQNKDAVKKKNAARRGEPEWKNKRFIKTLKKRYGITVEEREAFLKAQDGACYVCGQKDGEGAGRHKFLCVDHDHITGKARGLLCGNCNLGVGLLGDDPERLRKAALYLESR